ncbi:MAG: fumarylacetoacetate hydrolase family protein [Desulfobacterales bacterium]|nr:fumarylacetoacetate hydrolase family protein [Desulfobacterales bacterium]
MKIGTVTVDNTKRLVSFVEEYVIDLNAAYLSLLSDQGLMNPGARVNSELPSDLLQFLQKGRDSLVAAQHSIDYALKNVEKKTGLVQRQSEVTFAASHRPPKIICTGNNYRDYRKILGIPASPVPLLILKSPSAVIGHEETVYIPDGYGPVYHEWEFSCIISKRCKNIPRDRVHEAIFGYTILNDLTGRSFEAANREFKPWGKNMDTFAPMGPWIVTADDMPDQIYNLETLRRRNGRIECESNTANMDFGFEEIIEFVSTFITLEPGDVVTTSTPPAGPITPGDTIEAEIEGIGILRNQVKSLPVDLKYAKFAKIV